MITYETTPPLSIGGAAGTYNIENPWGGVNAELMVLSVTADGAGDAWLVPGQEAITPKQLITASRVQWFTFAAQGMVAGRGEWFPYEGKAIFTVTGGANVVLCIAWRRNVPAVGVVDSFPRADRATVALGRVAKAHETDTTRWGAQSWANVREGRVRETPEWRHQPGTQGARAAGSLAGDEATTPSTPRGKLARLLRNGSLR